MKGCNHSSNLLCLYEKDYIGIFNAQGNIESENRSWAHTQHSSLLILTKVKNTIKKIHNSRGHLL